MGRIIIKDGKGEEVHGHDLPVLVADPSEAFLDLIQHEAGSLKDEFPVLTANDGKKAQLHLSQNEHFTGIFVNPTIENTNAISVLKVAHLHHPTTPVYLLLDGPHAFDAATVKRLGIHGEVSKPVSYKQLCEQFDTHTIHFDPQKAVETGDAVPIGKKHEGKDDHFVPVRSRSFMAGKKSFFDIFLKLGEHHYVKIVKGGDEFTPERIAHFVKKGVESFYIHKESQEQYLAYCDKILDHLSKSEKVQAQAKIPLALSHGQNTLEYLRDRRNLEEAGIDFAVKYTTSVWNLVDELQLRTQSGILDAFLNELTTCDHGVGTVFLVGLLAREFGFETERSAKTLGIAALLHDVGLYDGSVDLQKEDEQHMTAEDSRVFREHPEKGTRILQSIKRVDRAVPQIVHYHHYRRDGSGFPEKMGSVSTVPAEIVGICEAYARFMQREKENPLEDRSFQLDMQVLNGFSVDVVEKFRKVFQIKD